MVERKVGRYPAFVSTGDGRKYRLMGAKRTTLLMLTALAANKSQRVICSLVKIVIGRSPRRTRASQQHQQLHDLLIVPVSFPEFNELADDLGPCKDYCYLFDRLRAEGSCRRPGCGTGTASQSASWGCPAPPVGTRRVFAAPPRPYSARQKGTSVNVRSEASRPGSSSIDRSPILAPIRSPGRAPCSAIHSRTSWSFVGPTK